MRWLSSTVKAQIKVWRNGISFGLNDLDALFTVARGQGVDLRSRLEALIRFYGKPPSCSKILRAEYRHVPSIFNGFGRILSQFQNK